MGLAQGDRFAQREALAQRLARLLQVGPGVGGQPVRLGLVGVAVAAGGAAVVARLGRRTPAEGELPLQAPGRCDGQALEAPRPQGIVGVTDGDREPLACQAREDRDAVRVRQGLLTAGDRDHGALDGQLVGSQHRDGDQALRPQQLELGVQPDLLTRHQFDRPEHGGLMPLGGHQQLVASSWQPGQLVVPGAVGHGLMASRQADHRGALEGGAAGVQHRAEDHTVFLRMLGQGRVGAGRARGWEAEGATTAERQESQGDDGAHVIPRGRHTVVFIYGT